MTPDKTAQPLVSVVQPRRPNATTSIGASFIPWTPPVAEIAPANTPLTLAQKAELVLVALIGIADDADTLFMRQSPTGDVDVFAPSGGTAVVELGGPETPFEIVVEQLYQRLCTVRGRAVR